MEHGEIAMQFVRDNMRHVRAMSEETKEQVTRLKGFADGIAAVESLGPEPVTSVVAVTKTVGEIAQTAYDIALRTDSSTVALAHSVEALAGLMDQLIKDVEHQRRDS